MKLAIFGAGAIGGYLAVKLHQAGATVTVIARGPHLAAIRANGLTLKSEGETVTVRLPSTDKAADAGPQDYVVVTLKANGLVPAAPEIAKLMGPETVLGPGHPTAFLIGISMAWKVPGATGWSNAWTPAASFGISCRRARRSERSSIPRPKSSSPAVIEHTYGNRFTLGEPDGSKSGRASKALSQLLMKAGLKAPMRSTSATKSG